MASSASHQQPAPVIRLLGFAGCLAIIFSYRPASQAEEGPAPTAPAVEQPQTVEEPAPVQGLKRSGPIFRTASYLEEKSVLVPPPLPSYDRAPTVGAEVKDVTPVNDVQEFIEAEPKASTPALAPREMPLTIDNTAPHTEVVGDNWTITISPGRSAKKSVDASDYNKIYQKIPYRRSEYLANPSYRHEATMEILFGELRPTVNHHTKAPEIIRNPRPQAIPDNQFLSNDYWRYHPPALRYFNRYLPLQF